MCARIWKGLVGKDTHRQHGNLDRQQSLQHRSSDVVTQNKVHEVYLGALGIALYSCSRHALNVILLIKQVIFCYMLSSVQCFLSWQSV